MLLSNFAKFVQVQLQLKSPDGVLGNHEKHLPKRKDGGYRRVMFRKEFWYRKCNAYQKAPVGLTKIPHYLWSLARLARKTIHTEDA